MPSGKGTYGRQRGRPSKKKKEKISILLPPGEIAEKYEQKRRRRCFKSLL